MTRKFLPFLWAFTLLLFIMQVPAHAATYVIAPFKISGSQGYSYLAQAMPSMLSSRLFLQGQFEPSSKQNLALKEKTPINLNSAQSFAKKFSSDYVVWGTVTVMGNDASLDISVLSPKGKIWKKASTTTTNELLKSMQDIADSINIEVFGRTDITRQNVPSGNGAPNRGFVKNETGGAAPASSGAFLNPSLRYQGTTDSISQLRSQFFNYETISVEVADFNGDKRNEVLIASPSYLYLYKWEKGNQLTKISEYRIPGAISPVFAKVFKQGKKQYIALCGTDPVERSAYSQILEYNNGQFIVVDKFIRMYLNTVVLPPAYDIPILIGQDSDRGKMVSGGIYQIFLEGNKAKRSGKLTNLPKGANVFNFTWIPPERDGKGNAHLAMLTERETLATYDTKGERLSVTSDIYGGSSMAIIGDRSLEGTPTEKNSLTEDISDQILHYVPMRMIAKDIDRDGKTELLVNKPITTAGKIFSNYRTYPQGEIHAMLWNGLGLELLWKTRRITGTVIDINLADINNDGQLDLVVAVNAYAGFNSGFRDRSTIIVYPLDQTKTNAKPNFAE